mgnify:CR=1 FL=1
MNLEEIERRVLKYLKETSTPLVPVDTLLRFLQRRGEFPELSEADLVQFLRKHELFRVIEPLPMEDPEAARELAEAGFVPRPRVILVTRMPSTHDIKAGMREELERIQAALEAALEEARERRDGERVRKLRAAIRRAERLWKRIEEVL